MSLFVVSAEPVAGGMLAIDPGPTESAWVVFENGKPMLWAKSPNEEVLAVISQRRIQEALAVEMIASYGMPVGREVFETCVWIGRFIERHGGEHRLVYRKDVKLHLCGSFKAKDGNVRQALIDRYGPGKDAAIGRKASPGPLYGMAGDCWSALAVAVTVADGQ